MKKLLSFFLLLFALASCSKAQLNSPSWWGGLNTSECVSHVVVSTVPLPNPFPPPTYVPVAQTVWFDCSGEYMSLPHNFTAAPSDPIGTPTPEAGLNRKIDFFTTADYQLTKYYAENGIKPLVVGESGVSLSSFWLRPLGYQQLFNWFNNDSYYYLVEKGSAGSININIVAHDSFTDNLSVQVFDPWVSLITPIYNLTTGGGTFNVVRSISEETSFAYVRVFASGQFHGSVTIN